MKELDDKTATRRYLTEFIDTEAFASCAEAIKEEIEAILKNKKRTGEPEEELQYYVCRFFTPQGVLVIRRAEPCVCLLIVDNERAMRDLLRHVPENRQVCCLFEESYRSVVQEYILTDEERKEPGIARGCRSAENRLSISQNTVVPYAIESKKHPVVSELKEYNSLGGRVKAGRFAIEGMLLVRRALADGLTVEKVLYSRKDEDEEIRQVIGLCRDRKIPCYRTTSGIMGAVTTTHPVPDILCSVRMAVRHQKELLFSEKKNFFLILDGISNPDNLGIILRTADACGISGVILLSNSTHYLNKNAVRGARGAMGKIPVYMCDRDEQLFADLKERRFHIIGTSARFDSCSAYEVDYTYDHIAVVVGSESTGVRKEILNLCTEYAKIPMAAGQSSLNIAVAAAVMMYEYVRILQ